GCLISKTNAVDGLRRVARAGGFLFNRGGKGYIVTAGHLLAPPLEDPARQTIEILETCQGNSKGDFYNFRTIVSWETIPGYDNSKRSDVTQPDLLVGVADAPFDEGTVPDL